MKHLEQQHVLVLGLGLSGLALARWCVRCGAQVTVADTRPAPPQLQALRDTVPSARFVHGDMVADLLAGPGTAPPDRTKASTAPSGGSEAWGFPIRLVLKSPGLAPSSVAGVMDAAQAQGLPCGNELSLFAQALLDLKAAQGYAPKVIGITGTNGKTTVTALTGRLLARAGKSVAVAGNIGPTLLDTLAARLDAADLPEVWVLELSSFQLDRVNNFEPSAATVLNLSEDHLDWHGSMPAYSAAKFNIYGKQGRMLLNRDDSAVMASLPSPVKGKPLRHYVTFGGDEPQRPGDYGIETVNGMAWLVRAAEADESIKKKKRPPASLPPEEAIRAPRQYDDEEVALYLQRLMPVEALRIRGRHNATNALAALALAGAVGGSMAPMLHGLREYAGEPHRVASVAVVREVEYFDDSKGTNVGATVAALTGLGAGRKLVLIAGGEGKGQDFSPLAEPVLRHARAVILIGRDAPVLRAALEGTGITLLDADSMQAAVGLAAHHAQPGDAVLMSPACASFDMFDNYEHRARVFCEAVLELAQDAGVVS